MPPTSHDEIKKIRNKRYLIYPVKEARLVFLIVAVFELHTFQRKQKDRSNQAYQVQKNNPDRFILMVKYLIDKWHNKAANVKPKLKLKEPLRLLKFGINH